MFTSLLERLPSLKRDVGALSVAVRDHRTPWYAKAVAALVVAYALSPIDLIPDFIPILGHVDDLLLIPLGVALVLKLVPREVMEEARASAAESKRSFAGLLLVIGAWIAIWLAIYLALN